MSVFVTRPKKNGKGFIKPERVLPQYSEGETLHHLIATNPDCIYYTDDESGWGFGLLPVNRMRVSPSRTGSEQDIECSTVFLETNQGEFTIKVTTDGSLRILSDDGPMVIRPSMSNVIEISVDQ